jgi:hypothetical protein
VTGFYQLPQGRAAAIRKALTTVSTIGCVLLCVTLLFGMAGVSVLFTGDMLGGIMLLPSLAYCGGGAIVVIALLRTGSAINNDYVDATVLLASLRAARYVMRGCLVALGVTLVAGVVLATIRRDGLIVLSTLLTMLPVIPAGLWIIRAARFLRQLASVAVPPHDVWAR